jgi:hypothetical protein
LLAIAQLEAVKLRQPEACSTLLENLRSHYPNYGLLEAADAEGRIFCATGSGAASVADPPCFTRAMASDRLAIGNYWVNPTNGQKLIHFATQCYDGNGHIAGVVLSPRKPENRLPNARFISALYRSRV